MGKKEKRPKETPRRRRYALAAGVIALAGALGAFAALRTPRDIPADPPTATSVEDLDSLEDRLVRETETGREILSAIAYVNQLAEQGKIRIVESTDPNHENKNDGYRDLDNTLFLYPKNRAFRERKLAEGYPARTIARFHESLHAIQDSHSPTDALDHLIFVEEKILPIPEDRYLIQPPETLTTQGDLAGFLLKYAQRFMTPDEMQACRTPDGKYDVLPHFERRWNTIQRNSTQVLALHEAHAYLAEQPFSHEHVHDDRLAGTYFPRGAVDRDQFLAVCRGIDDAYALLRNDPRGRHIAVAALIGQSPTFADFLRAVNDLKKGSSDDLRRLDFQRRQELARFYAQIRAGYERSRHR